MQITNIACPNCTKSLKLTQALPPGTKVRCTGCGRPFSLPPRAPAAVTTDRANSAAPAAPAVPAPARGGAAIGLIFVLLLVLGGGGVGFALYLNRDRDKGGDAKVKGKENSDTQTASVNSRDDRDRKHDSDGGKKDTTPSNRPEKQTPDKKTEETVVRPGNDGPDPRKPDPVKPDPIKPDPVKPDPVKPDPVKPDPVKPDPMKEPPPPKPDPMKEDPKPADADLSRDEQSKVNAAIDSGLAYLRSKQGEDGSWKFREPAYAAIPGLVLLECGVPPTDLAVRRAAEMVRSNLQNLDSTYAVAAAIIFLDRLGNPADRPAIQSLSVRLMAYQGAGGGWGYGGGVPARPDTDAAFLKALVLTRPKNNLELFVEGAEGKPSAKLLGVKPELIPDIKFDPDAVFQNNAFRQLVASLPPILSQAPALRAPSTLPAKPVEDTVDNSNTQFAVLGLLAAARHDVPVERSLALAARHFRRVQGADGGWSYKNVGGPGTSTSSMTCAGLLGLAVGHGLLATAKPGIPGAKVLDDPDIQRGLRKAASYIGGKIDPKCPESNDNPNAFNLYSLWSLERVGVLYNLHKIDGKEWYPWGARQLVKAQQEPGCWHFQNYIGSDEIIDTSLCLLYLKRANLAKELTLKINKLELIGDKPDKPEKP
jgi:hypothetical protein